MSYELRLLLSAATQSGLAVSAQLYTATALVKTIVLTEEPDGSGNYTNTSDITDLPIGLYSVKYVLPDSSDRMVAADSLQWNGSVVISESLAVAVTVNPTSGGANLAATVVGGQAPYTYAWTGDGLTFNNATSATPQVAASISGAYTATVLVTDYNSATVTDSVSFSVVLPPPTNNDDYPFISVQPNTNQQFVFSSNNGVRVTLVVPTGYTAYYTTNGDTPTQTSLRYSTPFQIFNSCLLLVMFASGGSSIYSSVTFKYTG